MASTKGRLSGEEKAAILLRAIGEDAAAEVMRHLDPKDIRKIGSHMANVSNISAEEETEVLKEFGGAAQGGDIGFEGKQYIKAILNKALGNEKASRIMDSLTTMSYPGIEALKWLDSKTVANLMKNEHPQTIAVVLSQLDSEPSSQVLAALPEHLQTDVALRLATMEEVAPEVLSGLSESLQESLAGATTAKAMNVMGPKVIADILARLDKTTEGTIMSSLTERNPALAEAIRSLMFVFDDLVKLDDRGMQEILKEVSKEDLPLALKAAGPDVRDKIFRNMSRRAAEMIREDMEARGPAKLSDVERAQQNILKTCRKLEEEGRVVIGGGGEELI